MRLATSNAMTTLVAASTVLGDNVSSPIAFTLFLSVSSALTFSRHPLPQ